VVIDTLTGENRILRADILHDAGASLNPALDIGQIEGGYVQGAGWLTTEELVWDDKGRLRTHAPSTYKIPAMGDRPRDLQRRPVGRRQPRGDDPPLQGRGRAAVHAGHLGADGAVGCGGGLRRRLGLSRLDAPATPERVLGGRRARGGRCLTARPWRAAVARARDSGWCGW
jgi:xanthine dehydrogenase large subunit